MENLPDSGYTCETVLYKKINRIELFMDVYQPDNKKTDASMVLFFGGGWNNGDRKALSHFARVFSAKGMTVFCPDYRIRSLHKSTPFDSIKDACSAMRFVKSNAERFGINPQNAGAGGGSAGGHVALCTFFVPLDENGENSTVTPEPAFFTLFNPALDTTALNSPASYALFEGRNAEASPFHHLKPGAPPEIIFHGSDDKLVPLDCIERFRDKSTEMGNYCELVVYPGQGHGFFHYAKNPRIFFDIAGNMEKFLISKNFLNSE
ncbi:MAG: alpha/beta hydrolase [Treponema sp.]|nr:alpha/beta hydrolase [Treponema sp.]